MQFDLCESNSYLFKNVDCQANYMEYQKYVHDLVILRLNPEPWGLVVFVIKAGFLL